MRPREQAVPPGATETSTFVTSKASHDDAVATIGRIPAVPSILDVVCRTTGMGFAAVARVTDDRWIACSVKDDIAFGLKPGGELKVESTICHEIRQHLYPVVINDVAEDQIYCDHHTPAMYGFKSYISMPILLPDGTFFGTLCAIDPNPHKLDSPATIGMFKLFAELIAFHIDADSRLIQSEAKLMQEQEMADLREQFIAVLGHDLRNPLQAISACAKLMVRRPDQASMFIQQIQQSVDRMAVLIDNVLDFARGRLGGGLALNRTVDRPLKPVLDQVVAELSIARPELSVETKFDLQEKVDCDASRLGQLLSNLLGNAMTHGAADTPIKVDATARGGVFELSVANGGEPIPPAALDTLFQPFVRATLRPNQEGLGLGLYIASEIARAHGGHLVVTSIPAETRFTFRMPLRRKP